MILNLIFLTEINFITIFNIYTIKSEPVKFKNISQISLKFGVESFNFSRFIVYICFGIIFFFPFIIFNRGTIYIYILWRSEEHTSELQSRGHLVCRLLLEKKKRL